MTEKAPAQKLRCGPVEVAIWANEGKSGTFYNVTASRSFMTGEKRNYTSSFGLEDIPILEKLLAEAWTAIRNAKTVETE